MTLPRYLSQAKSQKMEIRYYKQSRRAVNCRGESRLVNKVETPSKTECYQLFQKSFFPKRWFRDTKTSSGFTSTINANNLWLLQMYDANVGVSDKLVYLST